VSRIWITRSTVRCGRAGMRLTLASPSDESGRVLPTPHRGGSIRISVLGYVNLYAGGQLMTASLSPGIATTGSGAPLPVVALPQGELLTVNVDQVPLFKDLVAPGIHVQPLRLDLERVVS